MLAKVVSCAVVGLDGALVDVEVDISNGQPGFTIVGLPDTAVQESRERVRAAIKNSNLTYPWNKRITVNLAPADLRKEGPAYDLPMAVGLLIASEQLQVDLSRTLIIGELSLDGIVRHTNGVLPMAALARDKGFNTLFVPANDAPEAALVPGRPRQTGTSHRPDEIVGGVLVHAPQLLVVELANVHEVLVVAALKLLGVTLVHRSRA